MEKTISYHEFKRYEEKGVCLKSVPGSYNKESKEITVLTDLASIAEMAGRSYNCPYLNVSSNVRILMESGKATVEKLRELAASGLHSDKDRVAAQAKELNFILNVYDQLNQ